MRPTENAGRAGLNHQILVFTYHKTGTVLFEHVMARVAARYGLKIATRYGLVPVLHAHPDVVILAHSLLGSVPQHRFRGLRIVRDPRDIWVSSYLYHRHCKEGWCVNTNARQTAPIGYPQVDFSVQHRPESWKQNYIRWLGGRSYQQNLLDRDPAAGLAFELAGYTDATLDAIRAWNPMPEVLTVKLESIAADFDAAMLRIFRHLGFDEDQCAELADIAAAEDIGRMDDATVAANPHIHTRELSKWRRVLDDDQVAMFEQRHGDVIRALGYETFSPAVKS